ncbi:MAG: hypothetical protein WCJ81_08220 [bacterium]
MYYNKNIILFPFYSFLQEMSQFFLAVGFVFDEKGNLLLLKRKDRQAWEPVKG